jgi:hypothetical protein
MLGSTRFVEAPPVLTHIELGGSDDLYSAPQALREAADSKHSTVENSLDEIHRPKKIL